MTKWRTIRDNYARNLKKIGENSKSSSGAKKSDYIFMQSNFHLTKDLRNTETNFNHVSTAEEENFSIDENEQATDDGASSLTSSETAKVKTKFKKPDVEQALIDFMESHKTTQKPLRNDDLAFFIPYFRQIQSLNMEQIFTFRMKTMQLLYSLRNNQTTNQSMERPSIVNVPTHNIIYYRPTHIVSDRDNMQSPSISTIGSYYSQFSVESNNVSNDSGTLEEGHNYQNLL